MAMEGDRIAIFFHPAGSPPLERLVPESRSNGGSMSRAAANPSIAPSLPASGSPPQPSSDSPPRVPTLDELYELTSEPDRRVVIQGVDWPFYEQLVDSMP